VSETIPDHVRVAAQEAFGRLHSDRRNTLAQCLRAALETASPLIRADERGRLGREQIEHQERYHYCPTCGGDMTTEPSRVIAEAVAAERERIYAELGNDHYVIFTEDRWTIEHSVECRLSGHMHECDWHAAVARITAEFDPDMAGRWRIDGIDSEGLPNLVRADLLGRPQ
jgi:hypothetical protein